MGKVICTIIQGDAQKPKSTFVDSERLIIGRVVSADIRIDHPKVTNVHALVEIDDTKHTIRIMDVSGAPEGVLVSGQKIQECPIKASDTISIGPVTFTLAFAEDRPKVLPIPPPPPPKQEKRPDRAAAPHPPKDEKTLVTLASPFPRTRKLGGTVVEVTQMVGSHILNVVTFAPGETVTIGETLDAHFLVSLPSAPKPTPFVESRTDGMTIHIDPKHMEGVIRTKGKLLSLTRAIQEGLSQTGGKLGNVLKLAPTDVCKVTLGPMTFLIAMVPEPEKPASAPLLDWDPVYRRVIAVVGIIWLGCAFAIPFVPVDPEVVAKEAAEKVYQKIVLAPPKPPSPAVLKRLRLEPPPEISQAPPVETEKPPAIAEAPKPGKKPGGGDIGEGKRQAGLEGRRGRPEAKSRVGVQVHRKVKRKTVSPFQQGLLGAVTTAGLADFSVLVSKGGALEKTLEGVGGTRLQEGRGTGGAGIRGEGLGGGGESAHISGIGTRGRGAGETGFGTGTLLGKGETQVGIPGEGGLIEGQLSKEEIRRVVMERIGELRGCYQLYLSSHPELSGAITLSWVILEDGRVYKDVRVLSSSWRFAQGSTALDKLDRCMASKIVNWKFPTPRGGIVVVRKYPFSFIYE